MGNQIKNIRKRPIIDKAILNDRERENCLQFPIFSFRYMTTNDKYNFGFFSSNDRRRREESANKLYDRLEEISQREWFYWGKQGKHTGYETISYSLISFSPKEKNLTGDENIYIFRVKSGKNSSEMRILGFKENDSPIYYIIGYDFDFSAYNHGS